ncbi:MAG: 4Fe-4S dicluster domain-containing protein [Candidatus Lokiarchaeota archaeon]|nr:4Fe-4S dicluster domain-containing protein [Candidatus Lokiarchaeota archaeon]
MILTTDVEKCIGCRLCELICSVYHDDAVNPLKSRIEIIEVKPTVEVPIFCFQCDDAVCMQVCTADAISKDEEGRVKVDEEACINCKACAVACPFGAIGIDESGRVFKCDLCEPGPPQCVEICPENALSFEHPEKLTYEKKLKIAEKLLI